MSREALADAARLTGVPIGTLKRWVTQQRITAVRSRGRWMVDPLEVSQLAELRAHNGQLPRTPA